MNWVLVVLTLVASLAFPLTADAKGGGGGGGGGHGGGHGGHWGHYGGGGYVVGTCGYWNDWCSVGGGYRRHRHWGRRW
jgi:hypothetical protein